MGLPDDQRPSTDAPVAPSLHVPAPPLSDNLKLPSISTAPSSMEDWASKKKQQVLTGWKPDQWHTDKLTSRIGIDVVAAGAAAAAVAPIVTVIDKAIIENASNRATISQSARTSLKMLLLRPHNFLLSRPFGLIFLLYSCTYLSANALDTFTSTATRPPSTSAHEHWPASHTTSGTSKFVATSAANLSLCVYKDNKFTQLFGAAKSAGPVPIATLGLFAVRDMLTVFASFNLPPLIAPRLPVGEEMRKYVSQASAAQFIAPAAVQVISTPLHLLGLDLYNRPQANGAERVSRILRDWTKSCAARVGRIVPAFGIGGVVNSSVRRNLMQELE